MSSIKLIQLSVLLLFVSLVGCRSSQTSVQIDRPSSTNQNEKLVKRDKSSFKNEKKSHIQQTSAESSIPIKSELDETKEKSLMKLNPITKLIGKFNGKPKRIPLPRTDLEKEENKSSSETSKEEGIPAEDISF